MVHEAGGDNSTSEGKAIKTRCRCYDGAVEPSEEGDGLALRVVCSPRISVIGMESFEEIEHTADRAFRVTGRDMAALLENAARAVQALDAEAALMTAQRSVIRKIEVEGVDRESLLVNWLNEILYLEHVHRLVCQQFHIDELKDHQVRARVETRECDRNLTHIKAVTFHNLKIRETPEGLEAEVVVDV
ncbi:MAG: archease [Candidatus Sulfotelmatobacter sp.]